MDLLCFISELLSVIGLALEAEEKRRTGWKPTSHLQAFLEPQDTWLLAGVLIALLVCCREPVSDAELRAVALLRALSFYAYRPERAFAGKVRAL